MVRYEWDAGKAAANLRKHRIDFADAIAALRDPHRIEVVDDRFAYGEERIRVIGLAGRGILFVVITVPDDDALRIISARRATQNGQTRYHQRDATPW
jgi:uncharacterized protein